MRRYDNIMQDNVHAPKTDNNIWLKDNNLYYYANGKWNRIGGSSEEDKSLLESLRQEIEDLIGLSNSDAIDNLNEIKDFLAGFKDDETLQEFFDSYPWHKGTGENSVQLLESTATGANSTAEGAQNISKGKNSHSEGYGNKANGNNSHAEGEHNTTTNTAEHAEGLYNVSSSNTLSSIGNGKDNTTRHNAVEVKKDGTFYISNIKAEGEYYEKPMLNLQDELYNKTVTKENDSIVNEIYIDDASDFFDVYNKEQIDDKIENLRHQAQKLAWNEVQDLIPILPKFYELLPQLHGMKIRVCSLEDYFSHIPEDDVAYVVFDRMDYSIYAVYKNRTAIWEGKDRQYLLKGQYIPGVRSVEWDLRTDKSGGAYKANLVTIEADENGYFEYEVDGAFLTFGNTEDNRGKLKNITQIPLGSKNAGSTNADCLKTSKELEYINLDGLDGKTWWFLGVFADNNKIKAIDFSGIKNLNLNQFIVNCANLKHIRAVNSTATQYAWRAFSNLPKLKTLDLTNFVITLINPDTGWNFVSNCPNLEYLVLPKSITTCKEGCALLHIVSNCPKLRGKLDFSGWTNANNSANFNWFCYGNPLIEEVDFSIDINTITYNVACICKGNHSMHTFKFGNCDFSNITYINDWFAECYALENLEGEIHNLKVSFSFEDSPLLTDKSIEMILNMPAKVTTKQTLTLHPDVYAKLTPEQIASVTSKGWNILSA